MFQKVIFKTILYNFFRIKKINYFRFFFFDHQAIQSGDQGNKNGYPDIKSRCQPIKSMYRQKTKRTPKIIIGIDQKSDRFHVKTWIR